jgi:hypothetical protein
MVLICANDPSRPGFDTFLGCFASSHLHGHSAINGQNMPVGVESAENGGPGGY